MAILWKGRCPPLKRGVNTDFAPIKEAREERGVVIDLETRGVYQDETTILRDRLKRIQLGLGS